MSQELEASKSQTTTSLPNIIEELQTKREIEVFRTNDGVQPIENAADALSQQLEQFKTERKQERFFWIFGVTALLNVIISSSAHWHGSVMFLIFSLIFLICSAKWLEVPWVEVHLERWLASLHKGNGGQSE